MSDWIEPGVVLSSARRAVVTALAVLLAACGGGGGNGSPPPPSGGRLSGMLSAAGGTLSFNAPGGHLRPFLGEAVAVLPGTTAVAGATVKLIEIGSAGNQVGADLATAVTAADGAFALDLPAGFAPGPRYVVRAVGATGNLDRLVTDLAAQDVNPATHATRSLVLGQVQSAGASVQDLQASQVAEVTKQVAALVDDVDQTSFSSSATLLSAMTSEAEDEEEVGFAIGNLVAAGRLTGTVSDSSGAPLSDVKIVARDFNEWVTRGEARTDANGRYTMRVAAGDYIVGALNFTAASMAASEWWTCNDVPAGPPCGAANMFKAARVTVGTGATSVDFKLEPGARVQGAITAAAGGAPLPGVTVAVRDFTNDEPVAFQRAGPDGTFRINLRPGTYTIAARNSTRRPFASALYNGAASGGAATAGGGATASEATPMQVAAGNTYAVDFPLVEGGVVRGLVGDGTTPTPNPVGGIAVRFYATATGDDVGAFIDALRTNKAGKYRMWLRPGTYAVRARGQKALPTVAPFSANDSPPPVSFNAAVGRATATLRGPDNGPLSQVKVQVFDGTASAAFQGSEVSNGDGSVTLFAQPAGFYRLEYRVDDGSTAVGTAIYDGTSTPTGTQLLSASGVSFDTAATSPTALGTIILPAGGELKGVVTIGGAPRGNLVVQVRSGGLTGAQRFTSTRTARDGNYSISLPAGTYARACAFVAGTASACTVAVPTLAGRYRAVDGVVVTANQSNPLNIDIP